MPRVQYPGNVNFLPSENVDAVPSDLEPVHHPYREVPDQALLLDGIVAESGSRLSATCEAPTSRQLVRFANTTTGTVQAETQSGLPQDSLDETHYSRGTLVLSTSGRSKYLGPSAASEWLKDVRVEC